MIKSGTMATSLIQKLSRRNSSLNLKEIYSKYGQSSCKVFFNGSVSHKNRLISLGGGRHLSRLGSWTGGLRAGSSRARSGIACDNKYENILTETQGRVGIITLNRPKALNALNGALMSDILHAMRSYDANDDVGAIVLTGSERAFAAGADIKQMSDKDPVECYVEDMFAEWGDVARIRKPIVAAVNGYALGGGCELAMMCDIILAGDGAVFGQPEINLGVIPGAGGTQRLVRAVGKSKAMEMCLTGNMIKADQAERDGLVSKVVPAEELLNTAIDMAQVIASKGLIASMMAKESVNAAYEMNLTEGLRFERRLFHSLFATLDQKEGMNAFNEKRKASFENK